MRTLKVLAVVAASTALSGAAFAQSKGNISFFSPANVAKALTELGVKDASARKQPIGEGKTVDVVSFSNAGVKHIAILGACSAKGCLGLELLTIWGDNAAKSVSRVALNSYNASYGFGKGFVGPSSSLVYSRYAISDGGVSVDNLKANIQNFVSGSQNFQRYMAKSATSGEASLTPSAGDMIHAVARAATPEADAVMMELGASQGLNTLNLQSAPVPDAPVLIKPAQ